MTIANKLRTINSRNVIAKLEGSDPQLKSEYVVYTAHWDHFGKSADGIFHGAEDDALGCSALIEMGRAFTKLPAPPRRSILFLAVTAEEQGLLGSQYYSVMPIYPMAKTAADINMDSWNTHGRTKDMTLTGYGASELDDYARDAAAEQGDRARRRRAREGLLLPVGSLQLRQAGCPGARHRRRRRLSRQAEGIWRAGAQEWTEKRYHTPLDVVSPDWDLNGTREDLRVLFAVGQRVAQADKMPEWKPGNEFKAKRDAMLKSRD